MSIYQVWSDGIGQGVFTQIFKVVAIFKSFLAVLCPNYLGSGREKNYLTESDTIGSAATGTSYHQLIQKCQKSPKSYKMKTWPGQSQNIHFRNIHKIKYIKYMNLQHPHHLVQRLGSKVTDTIMSTLWVFSSRHQNPPIFSVTLWLVFDVSPKYLLSGMDLKKVNEAGGRKVGGNPNF